MSISLVGDVLLSGLVQQAPNIVSSCLSAGASYLSSTSIVSQAFSSVSSLFPQVEEASASPSLKGRVEPLKEPTKEAEPKSPPSLPTELQSELFTTVLKKRREKVQTSFNNALKDYRDQLNEACKPLNGRLEQIDPALVGESRWGQSTWKLIRLFTWISYAFSGWLNREEASTLQHHYQIIETEKEKFQPESSTFENTLTLSEKIQKVLTPEQKSKIETIKTRFTEGVYPIREEIAELEEQLSMRKGHLTFHSEKVKEKYEELEQTHPDLTRRYERLSEKHPTLQNSKIENVFDLETSGIIIKTDQYWISIGEVAVDEVKRLTTSALSNNPAEDEVAQFIAGKMLPQNIGASLKRIEETGSNRREYEILYETPQVGRVSQVSDSGRSDMVHSQFVVSDRVRYSVDMSRLGQGIKFEPGDIRLGLCITQFDEYLKMLPKLLSMTIGGILKAKYGEGVQITFNLKGFSRDDNGGVYSVYGAELNNPVQLDKGKPMSERLKKYAEQCTNFRDLLSWERFEATFNNLKWE